MKIEITEEDINEIENCLSRTRYIWECGVDLWPFTLESIICKYRDSEKENSVTSKANVTEASRALTC